MQIPDFQTVSVRGQTIRLLRAGSGAPLLWLRGSDASDTWRDYMSELAQSFDVIAPEHPGFGNVERPGWLDDIGDMAWFYLDLIDMLGLESVHLAGHGLGGWIAAEMAIRDTRKLASLTVVSAPGNLLPEAGGEDPFLRSEEDAIGDQFHDQKLAAMEQEHRLTPETEDARIANQMVVAQLAWSPRWHDPRIAKWAHRIDVPALVVWGDKDRVVPVAHAQQWHRLMAGSELEIIPNCGHAVPLEKSRQFVDRVSAFAGRHRGARKKTEEHAS
ncbi:MAG: alpha/beta fold hydrolase [Hyphomicrobiales bacterium]|nr:alpha/beta fold hydrolase [Hyphomicrobiales bacterium]